ncbi:MAG TPA: hypothetical protein IAC19_01165 [Candidatus Ventricola gallistercoris]|nr:hypothetical protein [Candidatus Ventricola gallistercoris]
MLGVMTVRKEELKFREFDRYRSFYCGLCRSIGQRCGKACRMALSFEMTFLSMLLTSLYEPQTSSEWRRCAFHPVHRRLMLGNEAIDYCADLSALISYYDLRDGWEDERRIDRLAQSALLQKSAIRAGQALPRQREAVERYVASLHEVERRNDQNLDAAANLTGELMGELCVMKQDVYERDLREMGFYIGKFIYLCDCYEDIERDMRKGSYNPLIARRESPDFAKTCEQMLGDMMARAAQAFERLPLIEDAAIMRNILYSGIWLRFENASERRKAKNEQ